MSGFEAVVTATEKGSLVILSGTVNRAAKEGMEAAYEKAGAIEGEILLDFRNVEYINSTGIAVIVGLLAMARAENREVGAFGLTEHYREVFEITRLSDFMNIYEDASSGN
jgi:anti-sigma B factor antagonist